MFRDHAASVERCSGPTGKCSTADQVIKEMSGNCCVSTRRISIPVPYGAVQGPTFVPRSLSWFRGQMFGNLPWFHREMLAIMYL